MEDAHPNRGTIMPRKIISIACALMLAIPGYSTGEDTYPAISETSRSGTTSQAITLDFSWVELVSERAFLSICLATFETQSINHDRCMLRTAIENGRYQGELSIASSEDYICAQVWRYDGVNQSMVQCYEIADWDQQSWQWYQ